MVLNCEESFHTRSSCLTLLVHAHIVPIHDHRAIPHLRYLLQGRHCLSRFIHFFPFTYLIMTPDRSGRLSTPALGIPMLSLQHCVFSLQDYVLDSTLTRSL